MKQPPQLSDAEWQVMKVVWKIAPCLAQDIIESLAESSTWGPATIKTLINRMVGKGALLFEKSGKMYIYRPAFSESQLQKVETESFLDRVFEGSINPLLAYFVQSKKLSEKDLQLLEQMLKDKGKSK